MLFIYRGTRPLLPLLASYVHLKKDYEAAVCRALADWNWRAEPFREMGQDQAGNSVCCVVHGRYGLMYDRAMAGISELFLLDTKVIDVDAIINQKASFHLRMAACLGFLTNRTLLNFVDKTELLEVIREHAIKGR